MSNMDIVNPAQSWPFLASSIKSAQARDVAERIYDLRLSFILPKQRSYVAVGQWFTVTLDSSTNNVLTFLVRNNITNQLYTIEYANGQFSNADGILDTQNCYIDLSESIPTAAGLGLVVCAHCLLITSTGASLSLCKGPVHRVASDQSTSQCVCLQDLVFVDGYNTQISYNDSVLSVFVRPGIGVSKPFSYKYWSQYADSQDSDSYIERQRNGAKSINGLSGNVQITQGPSLSIAPKLQDNVLYLQLSANKA